VLLLVVVLFQFLCGFRGVFLVGGGDVVVGVSLFLSCFVANILYRCMVFVVFQGDFLEEIVDES